MRSAAYDDRPWLRFYPPGVPDGVNVPPVPLSDVLDRAAADFGKTVAVAFLGRSTSYRRLSEDVGLLAGSLAELEVGRGDRVALILPNCPQFVVAFFAVVRLGAIAVPLDPDLEPAALRDRLADAGVRTVIIIDRALGSIGPLNDGGRVRHIVVVSLRRSASVRARMSARLPLGRSRELRRVLTVVAPPAGDDVLDFDELIEGSPGVLEPARVDADRDAAVLMYTAGTTGPARGAMLTHRNLVAAVCQTAVWDRFMERGAEATLLPTPIHSAHGLTAGLISTVFAASTLVLVPVDAPELLVRCARDWSPSMFPATPQTYRRLIAWHRRRIARRCLRTVRTSLSFGQKLPDSVAAQLRKETGIRATEAYGLAETGGIALANPLSANARPGTVGVPLPGTDIRIVDERDPSKVLAIGTVGELAIRGPQVCRGYWRPVPDNGLPLHDGWLLAGDLAVMSPDGYVTILDRKQDIIVTSGFAVFPSEVESAVRQHDGVADCAAVGVPDGIAGQAIALCVVAEPGSRLTSDQVRETCGRLLPPYMIPREIRLMSEIPRTRSGSMLRRRLGGEAPVPEPVRPLPRRVVAPADQRSVERPRA